MKKILSKESLADQAFKSIKDSIIAGKLEPKEELPEEKLAIDLGISRTPIREALKKLAAEGLIQLNKAKPATVATFSIDDALHYMEIRRLLEIYNINKNADKVTEKILYDLQINLEEQLKSINRNDFHSFIDLDREFHLILASIGDNLKLGELIHDSNARVNRAFLILSNTLQMSAEKAHLEHTKIVKALQNHQKDLAKQLMTSHLDNVEKRFLSYFTQGEIK
ncbi:GntR family transcriptional regulator [Psychrobacillus sp. FJAT-51614]|uniref:GntR family transcriptional regulator n=1 Tax=Psychrobacillus mangrovi TaxID=3117745 RepID=A0ABU8F3G0_9BACI